MNSIVIVSQVFYPNTQSTSILLTDLALNLQNQNTKITVVCGFPNGVDNNVVDRYENFNGIDIYRCGININLKAGLWQRVTSYVSYLIHAGWKLAFLRRKETIIGVTNPPFLSILLMIVSLINNCTYYFIMHDVYPEGLVAVGKLKEQSFITKIWRQLNRLSYERSEKIVTLGRDMSALLMKNYALDPAKIEYIPNWSLTTAQEPITFEENDLARELEIQNKFVVQYSGNMGLWHDINTFVLAAAMLDSNPDIQFLFIGNGMGQKQAQELAQEIGLTNIIWMDFVPQEQLNTSLTCSHIALISLNNRLEGIAVPCKLYGILASGRAILAQVPERSEIAYVIEEEKCGFVVSPGDVEGLVNRIEQLAIDRNLTSQLGYHSFKAYKSKYTIDVIAEQFRQMLQFKQL
jgi:glycosyltransferase involved in cell wall biosynthesis